MAKKSSSEPKARRPKAKTAARMYHFMLNPYPGDRLSGCPACRQKTGQRKLPLVIRVEPGHEILLNYTCRYCTKCDLLMRNKVEIESHLTQIFMANAPQVIGNEYFILGTMERKAWRENMHNQRPLSEMLDQVHPFKEYSEMRRTYGGWFHKDVEPPEEPPPPSEEWVKQKPKLKRK